MMNRVSLPMEEALGAACDPVAGRSRCCNCVASLLDVLRRLATDPQVRRVFEIATHKVEYVDELSGVRSATSTSAQRLPRASWRRACAARRARGQIAPARWRRATSAIGLHALIDGLIQNWILDPAAFDLVQVGEQVLDAYLGGLAAPPPASPSSSVSRQCSRTP